MGGKHFRFVLLPVLVLVTRVSCLITRVSCPVGSHQMANQAGGRSCIACLA